MATSCAMGGLGWISERIASRRRQLGVGTICLGNRESPWKYLRDVDIVNGVLGSARLMF